MADAIAQLDAARAERDEARQHVSRLTTALEALATACSIDPQADQDHPQALLVNDNGDLDWALTACWLERVLDGATHVQASEHVQALVDADDLETYTGPVGRETIVDALTHRPVRTLAVPTGPQQAPGSPASPTG